MEPTTLSLHFNYWIDRHFERVESLVMIDMTKLCFIFCYAMFESLYLFLVCYKLMFELFLFPISKLFDFMQPDERTSFSLLEPIILISGLYDL